MASGNNGTKDELIKSFPLIGISLIRRILNNDNSEHQSTNTDVHSTFRSSLFRCDVRNMEYVIKFEYESFSKAKDASEIKDIDNIKTIVILVIHNARSINKYVEKTHGAGVGLTLYQHFNNYFTVIDVYHELECQVAKEFVKVLHRHSHVVIFQSDSKLAAFYDRDISTLVKLLDLADKKPKPFIWAFENCEYVPENCEYVPENCKNFISNSLQEYPKAMEEIVSQEVSCIEKLFENLDKDKISCVFKIPKWSNCSEVEWSNLVSTVLKNPSTIEQPKFKELIELIIKDLEGTQSSTNSQTNDNTTTDQSSRAHRSENETSLEYGMPKDSEECQYIFNILKTNFENFQSTAKENGITDLISAFSGSNFQKILDKTIEISNECQEGLQPLLHIIQKIISEKPLYLFLKEYISKSKQQPSSTVVTDNNSRSDTRQHRTKVVPIYNTHPGKKEFNCLPNKNNSNNNSNNRNISYQSKTFFRGNG